MKFEAWLAIGRIYDVIALDQHIGKCFKVKTDVWLLGFVAF